jgi:hypothetical protein
LAKNTGFKSLYMQVSKNTVVEKITGRGKGRRAESKTLGGVFEALPAEGQRAPRCKLLPCPRYIKPALKSVADDWARHFSFGTDDRFPQYCMYWRVLAAKPGGKRTGRSPRKGSGQVYYHPQTI